MDTEREVREITIDFTGLWEIAIFFTLVFSILKAFHLISWGWGWVLLPVIIVFGLCLITMIATGIVLLVKNLAERRL